MLVESISRLLKDNLKKGFKVEFSNPSINGRLTELYTVEIDQLRFTIQRDAFIFILNVSLKNFRYKISEELRFWFRQKKVYTVLEEIFTICDELDLLRSKGKSITGVNEMIDSHLFNRRVK